MSLDGFPVSAPKSGSEEASESPQCCVPVVVFQKREGITLGMPHSEHIPAPPWKAQPQPCIPKSWPTKQCKTALCSPFPDFPAGTFLWQICTPCRPGRVTTPCPATFHSQLPLKLQEVFIEVPFQSTQKRKDFKWILFVLAIM